MIIIKRFTCNKHDVTFKNVQENIKLFQKNQFQNPIFYFTKWKKRCDHTMLIIPMKSNMQTNSHKIIYLYLHESQDVRNRTTIKNRKTAK